MILYDASALFDEIIAKSVQLEAFILDLTVYEMGNIILQHRKKEKIMDVQTAETTLKIVEDWKNIMSIQMDDIGKIYKVAYELDLTFYDAAYAYFSKNSGALLKTSDKELYEKARAFCKVEFVDI